MSIALEILKMKYDSLENNNAKILEKIRQLKQSVEDSEQCDYCGVMDGCSKHDQMIWNIIYELIEFAENKKAHSSNERRTKKRVVRLN